MARVGLRAWTRASSEAMRESERWRSAGLGGEGAAGSASAATSAEGGVDEDGAQSRRSIHDRATSSASRTHSTRKAALSRSHCATSSGENVMPDPGAGTGRARASSRTSERVRGYDSRASEVRWAAWAGAAFEVEDEDREARLQSAVSPGQCRSGVRTQAWESGTC